MTAKVFAKFRGGDNYIWTWDDGPMVPACISPTPPTTDTACTPLQALLSHLQLQEWAFTSVEKAGNPYHDNLGRFTSEYGVADAVPADNRRLTYNPETNGYEIVGSNTKKTKRRLTFDPKTNKYVIVG